MILIIMSSLCRGPLLCKLSICLFAPQQSNQEIRARSRTINGENKHEPPTHVQNIRLPIAPLPPFLPYTSYSIYTCPCRGYYYYTLTKVYHVAPRLGVCGVYINPPIVQVKMQWDYYFVTCKRLLLGYSTPKIALETVN